MKSVVEKLLSAKLDIPFQITPGELNDLLADTEMLLEKDTYISDEIRILDLKGAILIQETTDKNEILVRKMASLEEANDLVENRLSTYEKMWDGCGCRIDYYNG